MHCPIVVVNAKFYGLSLRVKIISSPMFRRSTDFAGIAWHGGYSLRALRTCLNYEPCKMIRKRFFTSLTCAAAFSWLGPSASFSQYQTLGTSGCGLTQNNCHINENSWWKDDAHKVTVDAFYDDPAAYEKIARLAGVEPANMLKGNNQCMTCHGTIVSGKEAREVEEGVSCESCHGPGSAYKDPHAEGDPKLGLQRPGYIKGLQLGMIENKNVEVRGKTCVRCHYITDPQLISAGHPDGARFNYISGIKKVAKHWKRQPGDADLSKAPFEKAMSARGPLAQIAKAQAAAAPPAVSAPAVNQPPASAATAETKPAAPAAPGNAPAASAANTTPAPPANRPLPAQTARPPAPIANAPTPTAVDFTTLPADSVRTLPLPAFPQISDSASIQEVLIILKKRLEMLHQRSAPATFP